MNARNTDDLRIKEIREVISPWQLLAEMPVSEAAADLAFGPTARTIVEEAAVALHR